MTAEQTLAVTAAVLQTQLEGFTEDLGEFRATLRDVRAELGAARLEAVSRGEWLQRNAAVDTRFESQGREIAQLRTHQTALQNEIQGRRAPWWNVVPIVISSVATASALAMAYAALTGLI